MVETHLSEHIDRKWRMFLVALATLIVYLIVIVIFLRVPPITENGSLLFSLLAILATAIALMILFYWLRERAEYIEKVTKELDRYKKLVETKTHTYHVIDSTKEIKILNDEGDVALRYRFYCENTSERILEQIRIKIVHDGKIESLSCSINGIEVKPSIVNETMTINAKTHKEVDSLSHTLLFYIHPKKTIGPMEKFEYSYSYVGRGLYPRIKEEEYTSTAILHPTSRLSTVVLAPEGYVFSNTRIEVLERDDSHHVREEERVLSRCPPATANQRKMIIWTLDEPLLANTYRIYLSIKQAS